MGKPQNATVLIAAGLLVANGAQRLIWFSDWVLGLLSVFLGLVLVGQFYWRERKRRADTKIASSERVRMQSAKTLRWPWLIFAVLLASGIVADSLSVHWSAESWLDMATFVVSMIGIVGVFFYATGREYFGSSFWRLFRWIFAGVVTLEVWDHAAQVATQQSYSQGGTVAFIFAVAVIVGWIYVLQWIAMTRLGREQ
jgi:hypothetical protein